MSESETTGNTSVTDVGEPSLVRSTALDIGRGSVLAGRYQIEAVLGKGGSGIVLRAFDRVAQLAVAVKLLKPDLAGDPRWVDRFSRELRLARQLHHPNVCRVFDIGQADGHWFITMELAHEGTLRDQLGDSAKSRSIDDKLADIRAAVDGLAAIHEAGIVHRDVKPDNYLRMNEGRLVLSDFGLATNPAEASTVSVLVGTPHYMAPEVVLGEQASFASDVWSLGIVIHEILLGRRPEWTPGTYRSVVAPVKGVSTQQERAVALLIEECTRDDVLSRPRDGQETRRRFDELLATKRPRRPRSANKARTSWLWPAVAIGGALIGAVATGRFWRHASAESSLQSPRPTTAIIRGVAADWTKAISVVASFHEHVHCMSWLTPDRVLQLVVGEPRRAIDLELASMTQRPSRLAEQTFAVGCPQRSANGALLFERVDVSGRHEIMLEAEAGDLANAKPMTVGSEPLWLPSGGEFIYTADDAHAAVFSIPVMSTSIISGTPEQAGLLIEKAVAGDGKSIALRYMDQSFRRYVVIHDLPSLAIVSSTVFDEAATNLNFASKDEPMLLSVADPQGRILANLDLRSNLAVRLGAIPGRNLEMPLRSSGHLAVVSSSFSSDIWRHTNGRRTLRLTNDGQSSYPDLSARGDLIVQHNDPNGQFSIRLFPRGEAPRTMTAGPRDFTPRFLPGGKGWLYVDGARQTIRKCTLAGECADVVTTTELPLFPVASPDEQHIAYLTVVGRNRLKVVDGHGTVNDLGPARPDCPPHWISSTDVSVLEGTDQAPSWAEHDVVTGQPLRTSAVMETPRPEKRACPFLSKPQGAIDAADVEAWSWEESDIGLLSAQQAHGQNP